MDVQVDQRKKIVFRTKRNKKRMPKKEKRK